MIFTLLVMKSGFSITNNSNVCSASLLVSSSRDLQSASNAEANESNQGNNYNIYIVTLVKLFVYHCNLYFIAIFYKFSFF